MLGAGQRWQEECLSQLSVAWPGRAAGFGGFNEPLAHLLMAAADYLVVPSRFEPCGLVALCAVRYGTVPIVTPVGGLPQAVGAVGGELTWRAAGTTAVPARVDAVIAAQLSEACGQLGVVLPAAPAPATDPAGHRGAVMDLAAVLRGVARAHGCEELARMRERCMQQDVSWERSAAAWEAALTALVQPPPPADAADGNDATITDH
jgi:granule-bound starch synthase